MANPTVNTDTLNSLIAAFRTMHAKDSITPETLGAILQRISDLLATVGTVESIETLQNWYVTMSSAAKYLSGLAQGTHDRNDIKITFTKVDPVTGEVTTVADELSLLAATTDRAGAMKAQQVTDPTGSSRVRPSTQK